MTNPSLLRRDLSELLTLAWPVVLSRLGFMTMGLIDTLVVSRYSTVELGYNSLGWAVAGTARDFIGKRGMARDGMTCPGRRQFVGLAPLDHRVPEEGAQLLPTPGARQAQGHVTSAYRSAALDRPIALGLLAGGRARLGETVFATRLDGVPQPLAVVSPAFLGRKRDG